LQFSDAARLLSFYQEWLDDLFPKATFLDALAMVEKTGHKTVIKTERMKWIDEGKPKSSIEDDDDLFGDREPKELTRVAPIFERSAAGRATTPGNDDLFGDDIYSATPRASTTGPSRQVGDVPDEDDLDALMAEAEGSSGPATSIPAFGSIFGGGLAKRPLKPTNEPDDEDMEALLAEAEAQRAPPKPASLFGNGKAKHTTRATGFDDDDEDDMDALMAMADAEAQPVPAKPKTVLVNGNPKLAPRTTGLGHHDDDDMDALMAIAEAEKTVATKAAAKPTASHPAGNGTATKEPAKPVAQDDGDDLDALIAEAEMEAAPPKPSAKKDGPPGENFDAEEEAMAEMEGLW
jgi:replication fork protection complex subunit Csm3/Swi3